MNPLLGVSRRDSFGKEARCLEIYFTPDSFGNSVDSMDIDKELFSDFMSEEEIKSTISILAEKINHDHGVNNRTLLVGILDGGFMLMADLVRQLHSDIDVDFVRITHRGSGIKNSGTMTFSKDINFNIEDRHVIIVKEVVDSGNTLWFLYQRLQAANPLSLKIATLLHKKGNRTVDFNVDYVGKELDEKFLVGYGMDLEGQYRNFPDIKVLRYPN